MPKLSLKETKIIAKLASFLYDFLPGSAPPFGKIFTFADAAQKHGVQQFWISGSKLPAITYLLENTLQHRPEVFCPLILTIVQEGIKYRERKGNPITRQEIEQLNAYLHELGFRIPELCNQDFLESLPESKKSKPQMTPAPQPPCQEALERAQKLKELYSRFLELTNLENRQERGYRLQELLTELFALFNFTPRPAFRVVGEEIDGSFEFKGEIYLMEVRWREKPVSEQDLLAFKGKVEGKSVWTRGLFISMSGFSEEGLDAFTRGRTQSIILMDGTDLVWILEGRVSLDEALNLKIRALAETGKPFSPLPELLSRYFSTTR